MRVLLLNPPVRNRNIARDMAGGLGFEVGELTILPPLNLALIASLLRAKGHKVMILDSQVESLDEERLLDQILAIDPEVIIGNVSLPSLKNDTSFLRRIKAISRARTIARTEINFAPVLQEVLALSDTELCMFGECELEAEKIVRGDPVPGAAFRENGEIHLFPSVPVENLDALPLPARDLLHNEKYIFSPLGTKTTTMQTSRGCPFSCSYYCPYPLVQGKKWRAMSAKRVYTELEDIVENHRISNVFFRDACFTLDKERASQICELILENNMKISWWCETRINCLDQELLLLMKKAGCKGINIGVETGDPEILSSQAKEGVDISDLQSLCDLAAHANIHLHFLLLVGLPQENRHSLYKNFKLVTRLKPTSLGISVVTPYPGTPLYHDARKRGWIETTEWEKYSGSLPVMHTDKLSSRDLRLAQKMLLGGSFFSRRCGFSASLGLKMLDQFFKAWSYFRN